ncbi:MAG: hypothetical protein ABR588_12295 [Sphingomicrobium sp.]|nr:hypothetical protein [Sphingomonadales bacterium]
MHIFCKFFGHSRCKRQAYPAGRTWVSVCRRCGIRLRRVAPGRWVQRQAFGQR